MTAEIISVGTELLMGDVINTNSAFIACELKGIGVNVYRISVVGDNSARLTDALKTAASRADTIILTGGLGPTQDDLTKETVAEYLNLEMIFDKSSWDNIVETLNKRGRPVTENNKKQAFFPKGSAILKNNCGTAAGCAVTANGVTYIMLPGPPYEMEAMFKNEVIPILTQKSDIRFYSKTLRICGVGESAVEDMLNDIIASQTNPTIAPYAKTYEVHLRVTASAASEKTARALAAPVVDKIYAILGDNIYGEDDTTIEDAAITLLRETGYTIATAESCTGGLLAARLVNVPGASGVFMEGVVTYSNEAKIKRLGVSPATLEQYGAVSEQTAKEMAVGIAKGSDTNIGVAITGIAGPGGETNGKNVGLVYIAIFLNGQVTVNEYHFTGDRTKIRDGSAQTALDMLRRVLWRLKRE